MVHRERVGILLILLVVLTTLAGCASFAPLPAEYQTPQTMPRQFNVFTPSGDVVHCQRIGNNYACW
jgi:hypothetical protein